MTILGEIDEMDAEIEFLHAHLRRVISREIDDLVEELETERSPYMREFLEKQLAKHRTGLLDMESRHAAWLAKVERDNRERAASAERLNGRAA